MGNPDGGWYDDTPPYVVGTSPADRSTNIKAKKIAIYFNEFVKLQDAQSKVIISPPQLEQPDIKEGGHRILVELKDTLKENTTYTIDFGDAIVDNNENNPMGNYAYSFSTGDVIDTMQVSGYVLDAENLEPVKDILVGLYDDLSDTIFRQKPMARVSRTDGSGHFTIKGAAERNYRAYALKDADGDFVYNQKNEMVAFDHKTFVPSWKPDTRQDTIWRDSLHIDNILRVPYTHFLPDDITLLAFTLPQTDRYLLKTERQDPEKFAFYFSYGNDSLPVIRGLNFVSDSAFILEASQKQDTLVYWLRDTALINQDTLRMEVQYLMSPLQQDRHSRDAAEDELREAYEGKGEGAGEVGEGAGEAEETWGEIRQHPTSESPRSEVLWCGKHRPRPAYLPGNACPAGLCRHGGRAPETEGRLAMGGDPLHVGAQSHPCASLQPADRVAEGW